MRQTPSHEPFCATESLLNKHRLVVFANDDHAHMVEPSVVWRGPLGRSAQCAAARAHDEAGAVEKTRSPVCRDSLIVSSVEPAVKVSLILRPCRSAMTRCLTERSCALRLSATSPCQLARPKAAGIMYRAAGLIMFCAPFRVFAAALQTKAVMNFAVTFFNPFPRPMRRWTDRDREAFPQQPAGKTRSKGGSPCSVARAAIRMACPPAQ